jgi:hypothetical protein
LLLSVFKLVQPLPQSWYPEVTQVHWLPEQDFPLPHTLPQVPQLLLSVLVFTQPFAPQSVPEEQMHWLLEQVLPPVQSALDVAVVH